MTTILSAYLFSIEKIDIITLFFILIGSLIILIIIGFKLKTDEIKEELDNKKMEQIKLNEKLKIYEQLIDMKVEDKNMKKRILELENKILKNEQKK